MMAYNEKRHAKRYAIFHGQTLKFTICHLIVINTCLIFLSACSVTKYHSSAPPDSYQKATIDNYSPYIRLWADVANYDLAGIIEDRVKQYKDIHADKDKLPDMHYLALSGGGNDGAFAAGLLSGWSAHGSRPEFAIVSGISTGALLAPFAFLGSEYDEAAKRVYTTTTSDQIFTQDVFNVVSGLLGAAAITDTSPLKTVIQREITAEMFAKIGEEHRNGRRLFIGTTNLEAQRGVIWNIGVLANSGQKGALQLFHQILLASSAIPGAFEPVLIDVTIKGKRYQELHVDGGVTSQVFIYPAQFRADVVPVFERNNIDRHLYIIRNAKIAPEFEKTSARFFDITSRSISTLIKYHGIGDLHKLYLMSQRDRMGYNLLYITEEFQAESQEEFDPIYMSKLYAYGYERAINGPDWLKTSPGIDYLE